MSSEIPSRNKIVLELNQFRLSPEVKSAIQSLSTQMKCSPEESQRTLLSNQTSEVNEGVLGSGRGDFRKRMK